jgi:hypothetical protein
MQLEPCAQCRRHITIESERCPFCAAPRQVVRRSRLLDHGGRLSRAAVFAGAAACYTSAPIEQTTPPPPPPPPPHETVEQVQGDPPPDDVAVDDPHQHQQQQFSQPPPPPPPPAVTPGHIAGKVVMGKHAQAYRHVEVRGNGVHLTATTEPDGTFAIRDLPPGSYQVVVPPNHPRHSPITQVVTITSGATSKITIAMPTPVPDRGPCCKPYGAPPARRRVV